MPPINDRDPVMKKLVELTCGPEYVHEQGEQEIAPECEQAAIAIAGALSRYCGCPCRHTEDPICAISNDPLTQEDETLPEGRVHNIPARFADFLPGDPSNPDPMSRAGMRDILAGTNSEFSGASFVYWFGYCPEEVPDAWNMLMSEHRLPARSNAEACTPQMAIDEDIFNTPAGAWLSVAAKLGTLPHDTLQTPWTFDLSLLMQAANGFYSTVGGRLSVTPSQGQTLFTGEDGRESAMIYGAGGYLDVGYYAAFSSSVGLRIYADFDIGADWADGEVQIAPNEWIDDFSNFRIRLGSGLKLVIWPIDGFQMGAGFDYQATVTEGTPLPVHSLLFSVDMAFRLSEF